MGERTVSHHRATIVTPETWKEPWKYLWKNKRKHVKKAIMKCAVCFPTGKTSKRTKNFRDRKYRDFRQEYRDARYELYTDLVEDREWRAMEAELNEYYDDLYEPWIYPWDYEEEHYYYCKFHPSIRIGLDYGDCPICDREAEAYDY